MELGLVVTQTLAAIWYYRLFRTVDSFAASGIAAFGLVSAVSALVTAALLGTAVEVSTDPVGDTAANDQVLHLVVDNLRGVAALFFGLWLIPMGWCVLRSGWMPRVLARRTGAPATPSIRLTQATRPAPTSTSTE